MQLKLIERKTEVPNVETFVWEPEVPMTWEAGQYLRYRLSHEHPDDRGERRFFTIAAAPHEGHTQITTRITPDKGSTFKQALLALKIGDAIEAGEPTGQFVIEDPKQKYVFIAGGIGITPFRSILLDLDHRGKPLNVTLLYANRDQNVVFKDIFDDLAGRHAEFTVRYFVDPAKIDASAIKQNVADLGKPLYYISGPEPMVVGIEQMLGSIGIAQAQLRQDYFPGYSVI